MLLCSLSVTFKKICAKLKLELNTFCVEQKMKLPFFVSIQIGPMKTAPLLNKYY